MAYPYRDNYPSKKIDIPHNSNQQCCRQHVALNAVGNNDKGSLVACCWKSRLTPAVLCWKARPLGTAAFCRVATGLRRAAHLPRVPPPPRIQHLGPFYFASVYSCSLWQPTDLSYGEALADRIVSYRIAIFCLISYHIYRFLLWLYRAITTVNAVCLQEKDALFNEFLAFKLGGKSVKTVTSADGVLTMPATPTIATKPVQRKYSRAARGRRRLWKH